MKTASSMFSFYNEQLEKRKTLYGGKKDPSIFQKRPQVKLDGTPIRAKQGKKVMDTLSGTIYDNYNVAADELGTTRAALEQRRMPDGSRRFVLVD